MSTELITVIGTLGGVLIGTFGSFLVTWISKRYEYKRDYKRLIIDVATTEWKEGLELAYKTPGRTRIPPLFSFVMFASEMLDLLEKKKREPNDIKKLLNKHKEMRQIIHEYSEGTKLTTDL
jgi:preprotein translocase subunit Sec63